MINNVTTLNLDKAKINYSNLFLNRNVTFK